MICARPGCGHPESSHVMILSVRARRAISTPRCLDCRGKQRYCLSFIGPVPTDPQPCGHRHYTAAACSGCHLGGRCTPQPADPQPPVEGEPWAMTGLGWWGETVPYPEEGT